MSEAYKFESKMVKIGLLQVREPILKTGHQFDEAQCVL
jgi:hypothetical protein